MLTAPQVDFITASFHEAEPAYRNWYYVSITWITYDGHEAATARKDLGLYFNNKQWRELPFQTKLNQVTERLHESGRRKKDQQVGFGKYAAETVRDYRIELPTFAPHGDGIVVRIKPDARDLLIRKLDLRRRNPQVMLTREEQLSLEWLRLYACRTFDVLRDEDVPIWSPMQWWNTMPCEAENAPAGFAIPRGLCDVVSVNADLPSTRE
jgi:hypothetical protein